MLARHLNEDEELKNDLQEILRDDPIPAAAPKTVSEKLDAILNDPANTAFKDIHAESSLPEKINFRSVKQDVSLAFALYCTAAACVMYYQAGSRDDDKLETVGILTVNAIQIFFFSLLTADFLMTIKNHKAMAAVSGVIGTLSTVSYGIAAYVFASESKDDNWLKHNPWVAALLNASGNFSQNMFGVFGNIQRIKKYWDHNSEATQFTLDKMREIFKDQPELQHMVPRTRSTMRKVMEVTLSAATSVPTGVTMMFTQTSYVCSSEDFFEKPLNEVAGIVLGIFTNLPTIAMALGITGPTLAQKIVDKIFDICQEAADRLHRKPGVKRSKRELVFDLANISLIAVSSFLATKSSASSRILYETKCPDYFKNPFIKIDTDQGAMLFNAVMTAMAINAATDYFKVTYAPKNSTERAKHRVAAIVSNIQHKSKADSEALATSLGWKKPAEKPGCLSRFFKKPRAADDDYSQLENDEEAQLPRRRSMCILM